MYGASYILYVAASTCMVRAVLYELVLRAFSHFHAIYRCFPYSCTLCKPHSQLKTLTPPIPSMGVVKLRIGNHLLCSTACASSVGRTWSGLVWSLEQSLYGRMYVCQ